MLRVGRRVSRRSQVIALFDRAKETLKGVCTLAKAGVTIGTILKFPLRRFRWRAPKRLRLRNGVCIVAPAEEPLQELFVEIWVNRCYAPRDLMVAAESTIIDVGANVGVFTLWAATSHPGVRIISLEPSPRMCDFLRRNVCASRLDNVTVVQAAAGGQKGEAILYSRGPEAWNSLYCRDSLGSTFRPLAHTEVLTLDELFERFAVWKCPLLKLDCEGAEYEVLLNARPETLKRIGNIAMEYHVGLNEHSPEELVAFLGAHGFVVECLPLIDQECGYLYARRRASLEFVGSEQARASGFGREGGNGAAA